MGGINVHNQRDGDVCVKRHYGNGGYDCGGDENGGGNVRVHDDDDYGYGLSQTLKGQRSRSCYCESREGRSKLLSPSCCIPRTGWLDTGNSLVG